jgi:PhnB protein
MTVIHPYLTFTGNCREAMTFYKDCLGGKLTLQSIGKSPLSEKMPPRMKASILHATLVKDSLVLMGTDIVPPAGRITGNAISLSLHCSSKKEIMKCYEKLSAGGHPIQAIEPTYWGALFGDLIDKYGNHWLLTFDKTIQSSHKK